MQPSGDDVPKPSADLPAEVLQRLTRYARESTQALFAAYGVALEPASLEVCEGRGRLTLLGVVRFTGPHLSGSLMLGATEDPLRASMPRGAEERDWLAELTNQLIGRVKNRVLGDGFEFYALPPAVLSGQRLSLAPDPDFEPILFSSAAGYVCAWMELQIDRGLRPDPDLLGEEIPKEGDVILFWTQGVALQSPHVSRAPQTPPGEASERPSQEAPAFPAERTRFGNLVGQSSVMRAIYQRLEQAAASDATVLIEGDTGTGEEASAEAIHRESRRRQGPFVVVDCGSLPAQLLESELFGHERGSFTGAIAARKGAFEAASGGTIFLDEIGELALELQPKLLRVLERKEVKPVGTNVYQTVDVRVIAATNRDLADEVAARRFRSDLYYRLAVLRIVLPPLRERLEDLGLLVDHILDNLGAREDPKAQALRSSAFLSELRRYPWRGGVRELRNYVERCLVTGESEIANPELATEESAGELEASSELPFRAARDRRINELEKRYLAALLDQHGNCVSSAARVAGVSRIYFYRLLRKHGLKPRGSD